jgi:hypothetical protein
MITRCLPPPVCDYNEVPAWDGDTHEWSCEYLGLPPDSTPPIPPDTTGRYQSPTFLEANQ